MTSQMSYMSTKLTGSRLIGGAPTGMRLLMVNMEGILLKQGLVSLMVDVGCW